MQSSTSQGTFMSYSILVNGAYGKMGALSVSTLQQCAACHTVFSAGRDDNLTALLTTHQPDIVLDFTLPDCVFANATAVLAHGTRLIVGTSGLGPEQIAQLSTQATAQQCGAIIAPNFSLSAILMIKYAADAARYFKHSEIIETHHPQKVDAPSGTARRTAQAISDARAASSTPQAGTDTNHSPIHSLRLAGSFAEQQVIFADGDEQLCISQRTSSRQAMMPGMLLACEHVMQLQHLVYGMENLLDNPPSK